MGWPASARILLVGSAVLIGCGGDDQGYVPDAEVVSAIEGHALIVKGPSAPGAATAVIPGGGPPADGRWAISPDEATLTLVSIDLFRTDGQPYSFAFEDCRPTYRAADAALTELLDCPFEIAPGSYTSIGISASTTYEMLIDDAVNGLFTDPNATTKLATSGGPGQAVSFTVPGPGGEGDVLANTAFLIEPLVIDETTTEVSVQILVDMIHTIGVTVEGGVATVDTSAPTLPAVFVPSASGAARSEFYSRADSGLNQMIGPVGQTDTWQGARVFFAEGDQPSYVFYPTPGPSQVYGVAPAQPPWGALETKPGGYLGIDDTNTMCWAMATDYTWTTYSSICRMPVVAAGAGTTIECESTSDVPAPTSGSTYASGCPTLSQVDSSLTVHRVD